LTLKHDDAIELELIDADLGGFDPDALDADLVGISAMTATAPWAYGAADAIRARGLRVVLGGIHATALPDEAGLHADAIVAGEAESVWGEVLEDARAGRLRQRYVGERLPLDDLPLPLTGRVKGPYRFRALFTARGCPYGCTFCSVRRFFGDTIRVRPIDHVAREVEECCGRVYFNGDDNIWGGDHRRSIALFRELARGSRKYWYGFGDLGAVQGSLGDELVASAHASGLRSVWVGWETDSREGLKAYRATGKQGRDRAEAVKRLQAAGIDVVLFMVLGARGDSRAEFERTVELADHLGVGVHPVLLTPLPGTELYAEYEQHLLPDLGWEAYNGTRAVFHHPTMSPREREEAYYEASLRLLSIPRTLGRIGRLPLKGFPGAHAMALSKALPMHRAMRRAHAAWAASAGGVTALCHAMAHQLEHMRPAVAELAAVASGFAGLAPELEMLL
jgi:radical SAM superfamily enzyme YgiQ (UPF0313 family)